MDSVEKESYAAWVVSGNKTHATKLCSWIGEPSDKALAEFEESAYVEFSEGKIDWARDGEDVEDYELEIVENI